MLNLSKERAPTFWSLLFTLTLLIFISCEEFDDFGFLTITTNEVTFIDDSTVSFSATINNPSNLEIIESGFEWGIKGHSSDGLKAVDIDTRNGNYDILVDIPVLPGKEYFISAYVETETSTLKGPELSFISGGQVNKGDWVQIFESASSSSQTGLVETSFSIEDITYFLYSDGALWSYNHSSGEFTFLESTTISRAGHSVIFDDRAYFFSENAFYRFDPSDLSLTKLAEVPDGKRFCTTSFLIDNSIYIGLGSEGQTYLKDFWKYSIDQDSWFQLTDFPGEPRHYAFSFCVNEVAYLGGGYSYCGNSCGWQSSYYNDIWKYDPLIDQWTQQEDLPFGHSSVNELQAANFNGTGYSFYQGIFYRYSENYDFWEKMAE